jgi:hypothetical protein
MNESIMQILRLIFALTFFIAFGCASGVSQSTSKDAAKQAEKQRKEQEKIAKEQRKYEEKRPINVHSEYDRFKDVTVVSLATMLIVGKGDYTVAKDGLSAIYLSGYYGYKGQNWSKPNNVFISFVVLDDVRWEFGASKNRNLILLVDGERMDLGQMDLQVSTDLYNLSRMDLSKAIPFLDFTKIANAREVEAQLGAREFLIEPRHLEGMRALIAPR